MNYFSRLNLSPEATAYVAKTLGDDGPTPAPSPQSLDGFVAQNLPPTEPAFRTVGAPAQDAQSFVSDVAGGRRPLIATPPEEASPNDPQQVTFAGPEDSDGFPDFKELSGAPDMQQPAPSLGTYVAPHWQGSARSERVEKGFAPEELQPMQEHQQNSAGARLLAADATYEAAKLETDADTQLARAGVLAEEKAVAARDALARRRDAYVAGENQKLEALRQRAEKDIDPDDFWKSRGGAGGQMFAALAVALGQFGASLTGGQNTAWQIIQNGIENNIRAQQENAANAGRAFDRRRSLYEQNLATLGDPHQAYLATKVQYLDHVKTMLGEQYAKIKGKKDEAAYHNMLAAIEDEQAKNAEEYSSLAHDKFTLESAEKFNPGGMVGGAAGKDRGPLYVPTLNGYARDAETARKLNEQGAMRMQINADLHRISLLLEESKGLSSISDYGRMQEIRTEIASLKAGVLQRTTVLAGQGAMSKGDEGVAEARSALSDVDPRGATGSSIERMRKALVRVATTHMRDHKLAGQAAGIMLGQEQYRMGPNGPEPVSRLSGTTKPVTKVTQSFEDDRRSVKGVAR